LLRRHQKVPAGAGVFWLVLRAGSRCRSWRRS
jgi:hypothetical protein